jgi:hypothetical protein
LPDIARDGSPDDLLAGIDGASGEAEFLHVLSDRVAGVLDRHSDVLSEGESIYCGSAIPHNVHPAEDAGAVIPAVTHRGP